MSEEREHDVQPNDRLTSGGPENRASVAVVSAVSSAVGIDPTDLDPPLYDVVDPDALDTLFQDETGSVTFEYHGAVVNVDHNQVVTLAATDGGDGDLPNSEPGCEADTVRAEES